MQEIKIVRTSTPKEKPCIKDIKFGTNFTDHMFIMDYEEGKGWYDPRIVPYGPFSLDPSAMVLHYAQEIFEGMKAYCRPDGKINLFRPWNNLERLNLSAERLGIPQIDEELVLEGLKKLVEVDADWVPTEPETSMYIRPFIIATDPQVGVAVSKTYILAIIMCPVGAYYKTGIEPVRILVEDEDVRAVKGGMGYVKTGGNYAASLRADEKAHAKGFTQVLWLDGVHRKYIEEVGTMNVMFKIKGEVVTPPLEGSILGGITRRSCLELLKSWGEPVAERRITIDELYEHWKNGELEEAFGTGTAAVITPIKEIVWGDKVMYVNDGQIGKTTRKIYDNLTGLQWGKLEDTMGWTLQI